MSDRLRMNGAPSARETSLGKRKELQCFMHFWFKITRPEASLEVIRDVCRNVKALKRAFCKTNLPIGQLRRKLVESSPPFGSSRRYQSNGENPPNVNFAFVLH
ncbi:MAG: hypothetical protein ACTS45_00555 [Candidatus Hodgkinia cicadicola]